MPLPASVTVETLPDPDRAAALLGTHAVEAWPSLAVLAAGEPDDGPFDGFVGALSSRLAGPGDALEKAADVFATAPAGDSAGPFVTRVATGSERFTRIRARLTEYAAAGELGDVAPTEPRSAVAEALAAMGPGRTLAPVAVTVTGPAVPADPRLLALALRHLLDNVAAYAEDGRVEVTTRMGGPGDGAWELLVADDGPGVPTEDRRRVVWPMVRLDRDRGVPGDGMGLAICQRVARSHGGAVFVDRAAGGGTAVRLVGGLR